jgi:hypothetical protein
LSVTFNRAARALSGSISRRTREAIDLLADYLMDDRGQPGETTGVVAADVVHEGELGLVARRFEHDRVPKSQLMQTRSIVFRPPIASGTTCSREVPSRPQKMQIRMNETVSGGRLTSERNDALACDERHGVRRGAMTAVKPQTGGV